jgi:ATP-binding cassette subfamily B (MDR/TAP) protein 1
MADPKPLPPSALAEGESAAMQAGIINASTLEKDTAAKDGLKGEKVEGNTKKKTDEGMKNYIVGVSLKTGSC